MLHRRLLITLPLLIACEAVLAAGPPIFDSPAAAQGDPDFAIQGEYVGEQLGVQVVALGDGEFSVVSYRGGLPGAGWDGKEKQTADYDRDEVIDLVKGWRRIERASPTLGAQPPAGGIVLFDGAREALEKHWKPGAKRTDDGLLVQGCTTTDMLSDFTLHLEFRLPYMPGGRGQGRGNSGVYYQGRYETQVLDSFGLEGKDNECGGIYSVRAPTVNACLPPLVWQTYDVDFTAARWQHGKKIADARMTVRLNGVLVQQDVQVPHTTTAAPLGEGPEPGPLYLQDHGNPVRFRNIWVLPRDLERESRRPLIPGFERFYATAGSDAIAGGRLLLAELNCTACHAVGGALALRLLKRQPPLLEGIANRIEPEYTVKFIADPHGVKPGTPMPDLFAGMTPDERLQKSRALVSFLFGGGRPRQQAGNWQYAKHGEQLYHQIGCVACHESRNGTETTEATTVRLGNLGAKYTLGSLTQFLKDPLRSRPSHRMPGFNLSNDEARDVAAYLVWQADVRPRKPNVRFAAYEGSWNAVPNFDELKPYKRGESAGLDLTAAGRANNFGVRFDGFLKTDRAGRYSFHLGSDDGSVLFVDGQKLADSDGIHPHQVSSGSADLFKGLHEVRVDYIQGGGEWTLELEIEGPGMPRQSADTLLSLSETPQPAAPATEGPQADQFVFDAALVDEGRQLFHSLGCAACHGKVEAAQAAPAYAAKPLRDCDVTRGCLKPRWKGTESVPYRAGGQVGAASSTGPHAPDFALTTIERDALVAAVQAPLPKAPPTAQERIVNTLTAFNCYACHTRDGRGGPTAESNPLFSTAIPEMGDEGRVPPPLDGVGDKLQEGWLRHVLQNGAKDRPYMRTRMPKFAAPEVVALSEAFKAADQRTQSPAPELAEPTSRVKSTGRYLVGDKALACIKCHTFGAHRATGIQAINLQTMAARIRDDWFRRYLPEPSKYRPGTRMPTGFVNGHSTVADIYDGDPARQIAAIWSYLSDGSKAGIPDGLIADVIELKPETSPIIYRNFLDGLSPRGIAVGYPEKTNLAWDANQLCLSLVWHGRFIDASKHWQGRGGGFQTPLGDHIIKLEQTVPFATLDSLEAAWPVQPPKERGYRFRGYRLDAQGRPTFRYEGPGFAVDDRPLPVAGKEEGHFERHLTVRTTGEVNRLYFLAASGEIKQLDDGRYAVGDGVVLRLQSGEAAPLIRQNGGRQELLLPIVFTDGKAEIIEEIVW